MARYYLPVFNLTVGIWRGNTTFPAAGPASTAMGNLSPGALESQHDVTTFNMILRLPLNTDIRDAQNSTGLGDYVEVPYSSGRWYQVVYVDDIARGFGNVHRFAILKKCNNQNTGTPWPTPIP